MVPYASITEQEFKVMELVILAEGLQFIIKTVDTDEGRLPLGN
jgi:hypothetical protein